ncbi:MAG: glycosyltransferase family 2 protein [Acidobacteria bacterium]|nr:glycosyltransferase family 2 protein [Acidobacteriota bacterium]
MDPVDLSVVIPAYNESGRLLDTLYRCRDWLQASVPRWEIVVVDDGSEDETRVIASDVAATDPRISVIAAEHGGKGAAVRRGMLAARGRWCFFADADLSMDLNQLPRFFAADGDVIIASREAPGARRVGEPWSRHVIGRAFNLIVRLVAVPGVHDTQCGYKMFSAEVVRQLFPVARQNGFAFDVELLFLARRAGLRIREVPITWLYRPGSRVRLRTGLTAFAQILAIRWNGLLGRYDAAARGVHQPT